MWVKTIKTRYRLAILGAAVLACAIGSGIFSKKPPKVGKILPKTPSIGLREDLRRLVNLSYGTTPFVSSDVMNIPNIAHYIGRRSRTSGVNQGEARFIDSGGAVDGLYTTNATSCSILIVVVRNEKQTTVGMAHADDLTTERDVERFYELAKLSGEVEAYVIGGSPENFIKVMRVSQKHAKKVKFYNADEDGTYYISKGAIVDKEGNIYVGEYMDFMADDWTLMDDHNLYYSREKSNKGLIIYR